MNKRSGIFLFLMLLRFLLAPPNLATTLKKMRKRDPQLAKGWGQLAPPLN